MWKVLGVIKIQKDACCEYAQDLTAPVRLISERCLKVDGNLIHTLVFSPIFLIVGNKKKRKGKIRTGNKRNENEGKPYIKMYSVHSIRQQDWGIDGTAHTVNECKSMRRGPLHQMDIFRSPLGIQRCNQQLHSNRERKDHHHTIS